MHLINTDADWAEVLTAPQAVVYKHSPLCGVSAMAIRQIKKFAERNPNVPVYVVDVIGQRDLSLQIAVDLGIFHQSPQAIVLTSGEPRWHASHLAVKAAVLDRAVCVAGFDGDAAKIESECAPEPETGIVPHFVIPRFAIYLALAVIAAMVLDGDQVAKALLVAAAILVLGYIFKGTQRRQLD
jgi:bacillithiol system protein YtxJ